jgi:peptide deformylase
MESDIRTEERMGLPILTYGNELLRKTSRVVPDVANLGEPVLNLIEEMLATLDAQRGLGLAAVQVGSLLRLFVTHVKGDIQRVFINPEIVETSLEVGPFEEGCLSIPGVDAEVVRPLAVRIQAWDRKGRPFVLTAEGLLSRVVQHETDHLNGILFLDRIEPKRAKRILKAYAQAATA